MCDELRKIACEMAGGVECPNEWCCVAGDLDGLCKAYDFPFRQFLVCLGAAPECPFHIPFNHDGICQCPLRQYLVEKLSEHPCVDA